MIRRETDGLAWLCFSFQPETWQRAWELGSQQQASVVQHHCIGREAGQRAEALPGGPRERGAWSQEIGALETRGRTIKAGV